MPERIYNGPFPSVTVFPEDGEPFTAQSGKPVEMDAKTAENLDASGNWLEAKTKQKGGE